MASEHFGPQHLLIAVADAAVLPATAAAITRQMASLHGLGALWPTALAQEQPVVCTYTLRR
jgi:hypothetical protein